MAALTLITVSLFILSALGVIYLFYRKEKESQKRIQTEKELTNIEEFEKDKLVAIIGSLTDGIVVFDTSTAVSFINNSAKNYLGITSDKPIFQEIAQNFPPNLHLTEKLHETFSYNRMVSLSEVSLGQRIFRVFINPVYHKEQIPSDGFQTHVIGATLLMQDLTREKEIEKMKGKYQ